MEARDVRYGQTVIHKGTEYTVIGYGTYTDESGRELVMVRSHGPSNLAYPKYVKSLEVKS